MSLIEIKKKLLMAQKGGADVNELFNTSLWTGTGAARTITTGINSGEGSLVWIKSRNAVTNNVLTDTVRGAANALISENTSAQVINANVVSALSSSGYSIGIASAVNAAGNTYVGWQFRCAEKFFDIVQYTGNGVSGRTIAHNLGVKPGMIFVKRLDAAADWQVYHQSRAASQYGVLNSTATFVSASSRWNSTEPTSSSFTVGNDATVNASGATYIAYLFSHDPSPDGFIQCGYYNGNASVAGPVITLGWRPQYLMIKNTSQTGGWMIYDTSRMLSNQEYTLLANSTDAEAFNGNLFNLNLDGFSIVSSGDLINGNSQTYIYMAIREAE